MSSEPCAGNGLVCTVHGTPWTYTYGAYTSRCEHIALAGKPHVHDDAGRRRDIGTIAPKAQAALHCACDTETEPTPGPHQALLGEE